MQLVRTTLRLRKDLKRAAEERAAKQEVTLQYVFNHALENYLKNVGKKEAKRIVFKVHDLGEKLDNLTRDDFYE